MLRKLFLTVALSCAAALPAAAQVGSPVDPNGSYFGPFGLTSSGGTPAYAQTFQRPGAGYNWLQSFTFNLGDWVGAGDTFTFQAGVYQVTGSQLGTQLYLSGLQNGSTNLTGFDPYTFATPNLFLDPGTSTFALVLQAVSSPNDAMNVVAHGDFDAPYANGAFYVLNNDGTLDAQFGSEDAGFSAELTDSPVPEPATFVLFGSGLLFVGAIKRRRQA